MKNILSIIFSVVVLGSFGQLKTTEQTVDSKINEVTVFLQGAQISRTSNVKLKSGYNRIKLTGLSPFINGNSIQIKGNEDFVIVSVNSEVDYLNGLDANPETENLINIIKGKVYEQNQLKTKRRVFNAEKSMILKNKSVKSETDGLDVTMLIDMGTMYHDRLSDINVNLLELNDQINTKEEEISKLKKELLHSRSKNLKSSGIVEIVVKANQSKSTKLELNYVVRNAGWYPIYDVRSEELNGPLNLAYKAKVYQKTGNNWDNVKLTLSTSNPNKSSNPPNVAPFRLYFDTYQKRKSKDYAEKQQYKLYNWRAEVDPGALAQKELILQDSITIYDNLKSDDTEENFNYEELDVLNSSIEQRFDFNGNGIVNERDLDKKIDRNQLVLVQSIARNKKKMLNLSSRNGSTATVALRQNANMTESTVNAKFEIKTLYSIPSDAEQYSVEIQEFNTSAHYEHYSAPRSLQESYLVAKVADWDKFNLLPGKVNVYFQGTYIGQSFIDANATTDSLELSLGRDLGVIVERNIVKELSKKGTFGSSKKVAKAYSIKVKNTKSKTVEIEIVDQIPVSNKKEIEISLLNKDDAVYDDVTGKLTWKVKIKPGETIELNYNYEVKYPKDRVIYNL